MPTSIPSRLPSGLRAGRDRQPASRLGALRRHAAALAAWWRRIASRYRQRRALAELDDHLLDDIGLTRADAERECRKPPWR